MTPKFNKITKQIAYSDLYNLDFFNNIPKLLLNFPNPNQSQSTSDTQEQDLESGEEKSTYEGSWDDLKFKELFNNDFELYSLWLDILPDDVYKEIILKIQDNKIVLDDIKTNIEYNDLYKQYINSGSNINELLNKKVEEVKKDDISILDIFKTIDVQIQLNTDFTIATSQMIVLVAIKAEKLIEMKNKLFLPGYFIIRDMVYKNQKVGNVFISIIEYNTLPIPSVTPKQNDTQN